MPHHLQRGGSRRIFKKIELLSELWKYAFKRIELEPLFFLPVRSVFDDGKELSGLPNLVTRLIR